MNKSSFLSTLTLSILPLLSLNAEARYLATAGCYSQIDGGVGATSASCNDDHPDGVWLTSASAQLATGELKASTYVYGTSKISSDASIEDVINIVGLVAPTWIEFSMSLTGSVSGDIRDDSPFAHAYLWTHTTYPPLHSSGGSADIDFSYNGTSVTGDTIGSSGNYDVVINSLTKNNIDITLSTSVLVTAADSNIYFNALLLTWAWPDSSTSSMTSDFGTTAKVSMVIPDGLSYTSESGVFLTQVVPVPPAAWLFGSGLIGLVGVARKKK